MMLSKDFPTGILGIQAAHGSGGRDTGCHLSTAILSQDNPYRLQAIPDGIPELHKGLQEQRKHEYNPDLHFIHPTLGQSMLNLRETQESHPL